MRNEKAKEVKDKRQNGNRKNTSHPRCCTFCSTFHSTAPETGNGKRVAVTVQLRGRGGWRWDKKDKIKDTSPQSFMQEDLLFLCYRISWAELVEHCWHGHFGFTNFWLVTSLSHTHTIVLARSSFSILTAKWVSESSRLRLDLWENVRERDIILA